MEYTGRKGKMVIARFIATNKFYSLGRYFQQGIYQVFISKDWKGLIAKVIATFQDLFLPLTSLTTKYKQKAVFM